MLTDYQSALNNNNVRLLDLATSLHAFIEASPFSPPQEASIIEMLGGAKECLTSRLIEKIFNYKEGGRHVILESFVRSFLPETVKVERPLIEAETARFDVSVFDKNYAIVIENKLKNAPFQRNQLARYVHKLSNNYNENQIFIIILPQHINTYIRPSAMRLPADWVKKNDERCCRVDRYECWCDRDDITLSDEQLVWCAQCDKGIIGRLDDRLIVLHDDFADWLISEAKGLPEKEWPMKSFMMQFADYMKGLFSTRLNEKMLMAIQEFLRDKILTGKNPQENWQAINETLSELDQLKTSVERLRGEVCNDMVKEWEKILRPEYPQLRNDLQNGVYSLGINILGVWVGCWSGAGDDNNNQPYWGFYSEEQPSKKQLKMITSILEECGYDYEVVSDKGGYLVYDDTINGVIECRNLYQAAQSLGYL